MSLCQAAHCRGLGRATASAFPRCIENGSSCRVRVPIRFSSTVPRRSTARERQRAERDQLINSLKESPGKRDARNFLKHFDTPRPAGAPQPQQLELEPAARAAVERAHHNEWQLTSTGVNLGNLYEPTKAVQDSPVFAQQPLPEKPITDTIEPLHLALVKLRQPQLLNDETLGGIALTLSQMARLGLNIALVLDCDADVDETLNMSPYWEDMVREQAARIVAALEDFNEPGAFEVDHALTCLDEDRFGRDQVEVKHRHLVVPPIEDGIIPVFPPWAYTTDLKKVRVHPDDVLLALTKEFAGINSQCRNSEDEMDHALQTKPSTEKMLLDRVILLDPLGGIPSKTRADGAHVFINLKAEYRDIKKELIKLSPPSRKSPNGPTRESIGTNRHVQNINVMQRALKLLPPSSSGLIITPAEAAISSLAALLPTATTGVRTRRSKNPLIHNLLTDKPMISSSLPTPDSTRSSGQMRSTVPILKRANPTTFLKKGIPVTLIPDPCTTLGWQPPSYENPSIDLANDPRINFPKLVDLIEDSFRRKLDAQHYLERIRGRVAGLIIAGDYEGGAICTWETPPSLKRTPPPDSPMWIPYLDKFAVLTKSQGSGGVADIVWGALTRTCFPKGLVWRSRTNNPVNKWYFERAKGVWNLPGGQWTMFWTTDGVVEEWAKLQEEKKRLSGKKAPKDEMALWDAYIGVCDGVVPSWADGKKPD